MSATQPLYLLYLDQERMGDQLFLQSLAQGLAGKYGEVPPCMIVHGSGEYAERALQGEGFFVERSEGVLQVETAQQAALVDRSVRQFNKKLVSLLTDEVVSSVGVQGINRNLIHLEEDGEVTVNGAGWIERLVDQGVVPVLSALAYDEEGQIREANAAAVTREMARAVRNRSVKVVLFTKNNRPGLAEGDQIRERIGFSALPEEGVVSEPEVVQALVEADVPVLLTDIRGLADERGPQGTWVDRQV